MAGHPRIVYHKPVYYNEMPAHIGNCSIFVLPSRSEAMGRVLVESMAAAKPRIGANVDGIPTVIEHGVDGLLFEKESVPGLASKLDLLMGDGELRRRLGDNGRQRALRQFTREVYFQSLVDFYNTILNGKTR